MSVYISPVLFVQVQRRNWPFVLERLESHPHEAAHLSRRDGNVPPYSTPLHAAVERDPPLEVVKTLVDTYPDALTREDSNGRMPLHLAVWHGATDEVIQVLLSTSPVAAWSKDNYGNIPIHMAVWTRPVSSAKIVELLVTVHPEAALAEDDDGLIPLQYLHNTNRSEFKHILQKETTPTENLTEDFLSEEGFVEVWDVACLLIQASSLKSGEKMPEDKTEGILHNCVRLKTICPLDVLRLAVNLHNSQLEKADAEGNLPLHIAAGAGESLSMTLSPRENEVTAEDVRESFEFDTRDVDDENSVTRLLTKAYPDAAKEKNANGKLPLHVAIGNGEGWHNSMKYIVAASPEAVTTVDEESGLFPFMLAACSDCSIDCVYELFRFSPELARYLCIPSGRSLDNPGMGTDQWTSVSKRGLNCCVIS